jgi:hypothetical protein
MAEAQPLPDAVKRAIDELEHAGHSAVAQALNHEFRTREIAAVERRVFDARVAAIEQRLGEAAGGVKVGREGISAWGRDVVSILLIVLAGAISGFAAWSVRDLAAAIRAASIAQTTEHQQLAAATREAAAPIVKAIDRLTASQDLTTSILAIPVERRYDFYRQETERRRELTPPAAGGTP